MSSWFWWQFINYKIKVRSLHYLVLDNIEWVKEAGDTILTTGYDEFKKLYNNDSPVTGNKAAEWDKNWLTKEQKTLQPIHEKHIKEGSLSDIINSGAIGLGREFLNTQDRIDYGMEGFSDERE